MTGLEEEAAPVKGAGMNACPIKSLAYTPINNGYRPKGHENDPGWTVIVIVNYKT